MMHLQVKELVKELLKLNQDAYITNGRKNDVYGRYDNEIETIERRSMGYDDESDYFYYALCSKYN